MVEQFLQQQTSQYKNINLIITHLSEILRFLAKNKIQNFENLFCTNTSFTLKDIPNISSLVSTDVNSKKNSKEIEFLNVSQLLEQLRIPENFKTTNNQRLIFMSLSGLRLQSSMDLKKNSVIIRKKCKKCSEFETCEFITSDCFNYVKILQTKTVEHVFPLLPQASKSYDFLRNSEENTTANYQNIAKLFNAFLKNAFGLTSHSLRKFLPNLMTTFSQSNNTGNWQGKAGENTMKNFYLQKDFKYVQAYVILRANGFSF